MRPSDIETVSDFIDHELANRELSDIAAYIRPADEAQLAFRRIVAEFSHIQSSVPCSASESVRSGNRVTGEKDG